LCPLLHRFLLGKLFKPLVVVLLVGHDVISKFLFSFLQLLNLVGGLELKPVEDFHVPVHELVYEFLHLVFFIHLDCLVLFELLHDQFTSHLVLVGYREIYLLKVLDALDEDLDCADYW